MTAERKLSRGKQRRIERTQRGQCARCGRSFREHATGDGLCPDGHGSYTWAFTQDGLQRVISNLEAAMASARALAGTLDAQRVLDLLAAQFVAGGGDESTNATTLAERLGWHPERVRAALATLETGCVQSRSRPS